MPEAVEGEQPPWRTWSVGTTAFALGAAVQQGRHPPVRAPCEPPTGADPRRCGSRTCPTRTAVLAAEVAEHLDDPGLGRLRRPSGIHLRARWTRTAPATAPRRRAVGVRAAGPRPGLRRAAERRRRPWSRPWAGVPCMVDALLGSSATEHGIQIVASAVSAALGAEEQQAGDGGGVLVLAAPGQEAGAAAPARPCG